MSFKNISGVIDKNTTDGWGGYGNDFLKTLYDRVIQKKPNTILEFGTGYGYTTIALAQGLRDLDKYDGLLFTYDHYDDDYSPIPGMNPWTHTQEIVKTNLDIFGVQNYVKMHSMNIFKWFENPFHFDLIFIDIHNNGDVLNKIFNQKIFRESVEGGAEVLFCGGSKTRDKINIERNEKPITSVDCKIECIFGGSSFNNPDGEKSCIARILEY